MKSLIAYFLLILLTFAACKKNIDQGSPDTASHLRYFGFALVDSYWDDPTDGSPKTNYADEVHAFCNIADMFVAGPTDTITSRINYFQSLDIKALLNITDLLYEAVDSLAPSGLNHDLRSDFQARWMQFSAGNPGVLNAETIGCFYIGEEPVWNGISYTDLETVSEFLKQQHPDIPLLIVEAPTSISDLIVPPAIDWIGFDHYFIRNPLTNPEFQQEWAALKASLSTPQQRIVVIMDTHYLPWAHGDWSNIDLEEMGEVAENYYALARSESAVIAIIGYVWPNGFDFPDATGARGMPLEVRDTYKKIGKEITGKY